MKVLFERWAGYYAIDSLKEIDKEGYGQLIKSAEEYLDTIKTGLWNYMKKKLWEIEFYLNFSW